MTLAVLAVSLLAIATELFLGVMLSVKAWSHLVYVVLSFALLGHGAGCVLYLLVQARIAAVDAGRIAAACLACTAATAWLCSRILPGLDWRVRGSLLAPEVLLSMAATYLLVAAPFVGVGFLLTHAMSRSAAASGRIYFYDLMGAGLGALVFFPLLHLVGPQRGIAVLAVLALIAAHACAADRRIVAGALLIGASILLPESVYVPLPSFNWESVPHRFAADRYRILMSQWHPLGRTELYGFTDPAQRQSIYEENLGTFEINVVPPPAFAVFANNYRSVTPVFETSAAGLARAGSRVSLFSQAMEAPYLLLDRPEVVVIGTGGGRDIYMARTHGATSVTGAEVNPATHAAMSEGGVAFAFSGGLHAAPGVRVLAVDGRHLVRTLPAASCDLVVLNGADTFAAIAGGAYTFAETYLYTREAFVDYLRLVRDGGIVNLNRWLEPDRPREGLRLVVCLFDALRSIGIDRPWEHVLVGREHPIWGITLVRKRPFTPEEVDRVRAHFEKTNGALVLAPGGVAPGGAVSGPGEQSAFDAYVEAVKAGREQEFLASYHVDISPVTDDRPFFYKHHRLTPGHSQIWGIWHPNGGGHALMVILILVAQTAVFAGAFILVPLLLFRRCGLAVLPSAGRLAFLTYFASIGVGFMLVELALIQRLVLLLGSALYSIPVTLASLLIWAGLASLFLDRAVLAAGSERTLVALLATLVLLALAAFVGPVSTIIEAALAMPFSIRVVVCCVLVAPMGACLGMWVPLGVRLAAKLHPACVAWALGVNAGFTVAGGVVSLLVAQASGFSATLILAGLLYAVAALAYRRLEGCAP